MEAIKPRMLRWAKNVAYTTKVRDAYMIFLQKDKGGDEFGE
jgi:hypothetical protein